MTLELDDLMKKISPRNQIYFTFNPFQMKTVELNNAAKQNCVLLLLSFVKVQLFKDYVKLKMMASGLADVSNVTD